MTTQTYLDDPYYVTDALRRLGPIVADHLAAMTSDDDAAADPERMARALRDASVLQFYLDRALPALVIAARRGGRTWKDIGTALGMTAQGAQQKYGR